MAWAQLGWEPMAFSEIEPFPCAVLAFRFPSVPNLGDVSKIEWEEFKRERGIPNVLVGGSPCQSFSVAGKREGLEGSSGLMWEFVRACDQLRPEWVVWENVPGALSSSHGEDFGCLLSSLDDFGYCSAWRVLDAQFFGVAQRRRRLFLVASLGSGRAAEVLLEPYSMRGDTPSSREKRKELASGIGRKFTCAGFAWHHGGNTGLGVQEETSATVESNIPPAVYQIQGSAIDREPQNGPSGAGFCDPDESGAYTLTATDRHGVAVLPFNTTQITSKTNGSKPRYGDPCHPLCATDHAPAICMADAAPNAATDRDLAGTLKANNNNNNNPPIVSLSCSVRRLTPRECERLQGFPDDWTLVPYRGKPAEECPDTPRYKALGNSMAVPVMRWIGERIAAIENKRSLKRNTGNNLDE